MKKPALDVEMEAVDDILTFLRTTPGKGKHMSKNVLKLLVLRSPAEVAHSIL